MLAKVVASAATADDVGVGDTVSRCLHLVGADSMAKAYTAITGKECGCGDRRAKLNLMFPYSFDLTIGGGCGNGDIVLACWIAQGHRNDGRRAGIVASGGHADIVRLFGQHVVGRPGKVHLRIGNHSRSYSNELRLQLRTPRAVQWQAELPWQSEPARPSARIPKADQDAADAFLQTHNPAGRPVIILYPMSAQMTRRWPLACWLDLAWRLSPHACVVALDGPGSTDVRGFPLFAYGMNWPWQAALQRRSSLVIGNDSAGVHVAVTLDVPALAIMGPTRPEVVFGHAMPHVVQGNTSCTGCHFAKPYSGICDAGCRSLYSITVDEMFTNVWEILK
jgi:hypothetical protein